MKTTHIFLLKLTELGIERTTPFHKNKSNDYINVLNLIQGHAWIIIIVIWYDFFDSVQIILIIECGMITI